MKDNLIKSVIGFNLKADILDINGLVISTKLRTVYPKVFERQTSKPLNKKFFTNFNEDLLNKIKDYKRINE